MPSLMMLPLKYYKAIRAENTTMMVLIDGIKSLTVSVIISIQYQHWTDTGRHTDGRTDMVSPNRVVTVRMLTCDKSSLNVKL